MRRAGWTFTYTGSTLAEAAKAKIAYHNDHLARWTTKRAVFLGQIRSEGIEVSEKMAVSEYANPKARDWEQGGDVVIRNDLRRSIKETYEKLSYHTELRDTYDGWLQVLEANLEKPMELQIDDWLFFFGRDTGRTQAGFGSVGN